MNSIGSATHPRLLDFAERPVNPWPCTCFSFASDEQKQRQYHRIQQFMALTKIQNPDLESTLYTQKKRSVAQASTPPFPLLEAAEENSQNDPNPGSPVPCLPPTPTPQGEPSQLGELSFLRVPVLSFTTTLLSPSSLLPLCQMWLRKITPYMGTKKAPNCGYTPKRVTWS